MANGTGLSQPPVLLLNTMNSFTQKYIIPSLGDNVFVPSPAFWALTRKGKKLKGGGAIVYPLMTTEETTGGAYYGDQLLQTAVVDSVQPAEQQWKPYYESLSIPVTDILLNRGATGVIDLVKAKFEIASASFLTKLCRAMWHTSPQNGANDIDDLVAWVQTTNNSIAGIARSSNTFWQPAANVANGGGSLTQANAEKAYQSVVYGYDEPDTLILHNTPYANFKSNFVGNVRYINDEQDREAVQAGFRYHFMYNNATVVADRFAPTTVAFLLNSKYIFPVFHQDDYFKCDPFLKPSNQRVVVSSMYLTWNIICPSPRMNVAITGIA